MVETRKTNYVFCIKPNEHRQNNVLEMALVQHQVRYMSLMSLVALWRSGHCYHINHNKFLARYKMLNPDTWPHFRGDNVVEGIAILIRKLPLPHAEFTIGTRKVFIRSPRTVRPLTQSFHFNKVKPNPRALYGSGIRAGRISTITTG